MTNKNQQDPNLSEFVHQYDVGLAREESIPIRLLNAQALSIRKAGERDKAAAKLGSLKAQRKTLEDRKKALEAIPEDDTRPLWCADYTKSLSGIVGTAEIPGEGQNRVLILPADLESAAHTPSRDGQLFFREGMTGPQAYFNAAILPGWQKHMPTFRVGAITAIDTATDTCAVSLAADKSSAAGLPINQSLTLESVPIEYMDCNADAFYVGDRVLVRFVGNDWSAPKVVGFESNPRECPLDWPPILIDIGRVIPAWDKSGEYTMAPDSYVENWNLYDSGTCQKWTISARSTYTGGWTRAGGLSLRDNYIQQIVLNEDGDETGRYKFDGADWFEDNGSEWLTSVGPDVPIAVDADVIGDDNLIIQRTEVEALAGKANWLFDSKSPDIVDSYGFRLSWFTWPDATQQSSPSPAGQCGSPHPLFTELSGMWVHAGVTIASGSDSVIGPYPGYVAAANPRFDLADVAAVDPSAGFRFQSVEEELLITSTSPAAILEWLQDNTSIPATIEMSQVHDGETRTTDYALTAVEWRLEPGAINVGKWFVRYEEIPPPVPSRGPQGI